MLLAVAASLATSVSPAGAATITEFEIEPGAPASKHSPRYIHVGPGGYLWYTAAGSAPGIGRINTAGERLPWIDLPTAPVDLASAPDGSIYFTADKGLGKRGPFGDLVISKNPFPTYGIVLPPNGAVLWGVADVLGPFVCEGMKGVIELPGEITCFSNGAVGRVTGLALGPGKTLWAAAPESNLVQVYEAEPVDFIQPIELPTASAPTRLAVGSDGNVWVTMSGANAIDRFLPDGTRTRFPLPAGSGPNDIVAGPDGALWYTALGGNRIGRITPSGAITEYPVPTPNSQPTGITVGPDGALWFTEATSGKIGRLVPDPVDPIPTPKSDAADRTAPTFLAAPAFSPRRFAVAGAARTSASGAGKGAPKGTKLVLSLSEPATVTATLARPAPGRKSGGRCVVPAKAKPSASKCTRFLTKGSLVRSLPQGPGSIPFSGKLRGNALAAGSYRATVTAKDAAGNVSSAKTASFTVVGSLLRHRPDR